MRVKHLTVNIVNTNFYLVVICQILAATPALQDTWKITPINPKMSDVINEVSLEFRCSVEMDQKD